MPIFLFQNALELQTPISPNPEAMRVPGLTEEILLEKIVEDSLKVNKFQNQIFLFSFEQNYFLISALRTIDGLNKKQPMPLLY